MIKKNSTPGFLWFPLVVMLLGCFVAFSTTAKINNEIYFTKPVALFRDTIKILKSDKISLLKESDTSSLTVFEGNVQLQQGKTIFTADKAIKNDRLNTFEAWGKVHINDSDTTNIYADHLKYFGNPQIANLDGNVKLTDGVVILTAPSLEYNMTTNLGVYKQGGKVVNKKTVITSKEGFYYSDIKDVLFKKNVVVNDPAYNITTDSLQYNTGTQIATFIAQTRIVDSSKRSIDTKDGFYNLKTGQAQFGKRPFINDNNKSTLVADSIYLDNNLAKAAGNAVAVDSVRSTIIIANEIFQNRINEAILATQKPLMIIKQEDDSIYVSADTLFSARLTDLFETRTSHTIDTIKRIESDSTENISTDSTNVESNISDIASLTKDSNTEKTLVRDNETPALKKSNQDANSDSTTKQQPQTKQKEQPETGLVSNPTDVAPAKSDSLEKRNVLVANNISIARDTVRNPIVDTAVKKPVEQTRINKNNAAKENPVQNKIDTTNIAGANPTTALQKDNITSGKRKASGNKKNADTDSTNRYFEAFHNVRIYSDSMQAISDSLFYSFKDSVFRMYKDPVVWGKENQISGDTILLHTINKKPSWMEAFKNGFMVNYITGEAYNQIKASRVDAYFKDGNLDSVRAKGSAECIYYIQDDDSAFSGINKNKCDIIDSYFENKQLKKVAFRVNVEGTIFPVRNSRPSEMKLEGFKWREAQRPKSKYELLE